MLLNLFCFSSEIWRGYPQEITPWVPTLPSLPPLWNCGINLPNTKFCLTHWGFFTCFLISSSLLFLSPPAQTLSLGTGKHACCEHQHLWISDPCYWAVSAAFEGRQSFWSGGGLGFFFVVVLLFSLIFPLLKNLLSISAGSQEPCSVGFPLPFPPLIICSAARWGEVQHTSIVWLCLEKGPVYLGSAGRFK